MSAPTGPSHRNVSSIRSPSAPNAGAPGSPHTPLRTISSAYGSPSALRAEEETVIIELGSRYLKAGFAGDALPKGVIRFGLDQQRRAGDYRAWKVDHDAAWGKTVKEESYGEAYELWKPDLRGLDLGLVGDKIDRAVRETFTKFMLVDSRPRRITLAIPSTLPLPLLSTILDTLFTNYQTPSISLLSAPVLTTVAAGLRSALVVDIGWAETVVTGVYEYREVQCTRSVRAMKMFGEASFKSLAEAIDPKKEENKASRDKVDYDADLVPSFEECEEVMMRVGWCKTTTKPEPRKFDRGLTPVNEEDELRSSIMSMRIGGSHQEDPIIAIPLNSTRPPTTIRVPFSELAEPCERALFAKGTSEQDLDDEELPLHILVYQSLLRLPVDLRSVCMARIVFVGGGSKIPGLKMRIMHEVASLIEERGWDPVKGKAVDQYYSNPKLRRTKLRQTGPTEVLVEGVGEVPAAFQKQEDDPIENQIKRDATKGVPAEECGYLRAVNSLGAWSGASLLSQLKVPAISIVDRDQWLSHGLSGASKPGEISFTSHRQSMGPGAFKSAAGDRSSWTLGLWG